MTQASLKVGILGASGYTGAELVRLLIGHPQVSITLLTADRSAGKTLDAVFPQFLGYDLPRLVSIEQADWSATDLVFCALPHGTTQEVVAGLPERLRVIDLSADFRLSDIATYAEWYGHEHRAPQLQAQAVYGLTELVRPRLADTRLVANPGCYPTASQLPLIPLLEQRAIEPDGIIIDAKSGVSGAGRAAKEASLFAEVADGIHAYGIASHRHAPEIEQGLSAAAGSPVLCNFTPHLMPMSRGILATIYVRLTPGHTAADLRKILVDRYAGEEFVLVAPEGVVPQTRHVRGTNRCVMAVFPDRLPGRAILISVIDNLVKGASGQAVQNLNAMYGWPEGTALGQPALFP